MVDSNIPQYMKQMTESITVLTRSVNKLVESDARRQERDRFQTSKNLEVDKRLDELEHEHHKLELERAREFQARTALQKWWWLLMIGGSAFMYYIASIVKNWS